MRFVVFFAVLYLVGCAYAYSPYEDPKKHPGAVCYGCHQRFSISQPYASDLSAPVRNSDVFKVYTCYKKACHLASKIEGGAAKMAIHMSKPVCKNCHGINGEYSIHKVHKNDNTTLDCNICHKSPRGWNSSKVAIPAYENLYIADSALMNMSIRVPPWDSDCGYCHPSVVDAKRLHDVHELVIEIACKECHGQIIESVPNPFKKAVIEVSSTDGVVSVKPSLTGEFSTFFENISLRFLSFYNFMKKA
jgi:hypothetical protein